MYVLSEPAKRLKSGRSRLRALATNKSPAPTDNIFTTSDLNILLYSFFEVDQSSRKPARAEIQR